MAVWGLYQTEECELEPTFNSSNFYQNARTPTQPFIDEVYPNVPDVERLRRS